MRLKKTLLWQMALPAMEAAGKQQGDRKTALALNNFLAASEGELEQGKMSCSKLSCQVTHMNADKV